MKVRASLPGEDAALDAFVRAHPDGSPFHLSAWRELVSTQSPHRPQCLVAEDGGGCAGILPLFLTRSPLLGRALVSIPYAVYGGALAATPEAERELLVAARRAAEAARVRYVELRQIRRLAGDLPECDRYVTFVRDLPERPEQCLELIPRKSRAATRHARDRHGMERAAGDHLLDGFYELFVRNKRALGSPVFARDWFLGIQRAFGERARFHGVMHEGRLVAAVLALIFNGTMMPYYSGSDPAAERLGAMNFLYWSLMEAAVEQGLRRFDFGRSRAESGAAAFKRNMGFAATPLHYQFMLFGGAEVPDVTPSNPRFDLVKSVWSRLPVGLVKRLGPRLMHYLP